METVDADLMGIGSHCQHDGCNQLDFLPFRCNACKQVFCQEHRTAAGHRCPKASDGDVQRTTCNPENYAKVHKKKKCSVKLCKEKLVSTNSIVCKDCNALTCLRHRLAEDHSCPGPPVAPPSRFRAAFGSFFSSGSTRSNATTTTTAAPVTRKAAQPPKSTSIFKKATNSIQTQLQDYRASHQSKPTPIPTTTAASTGATPAPTPSAEQCPQCGERFSIVQALIDHAASAHSNGWSSGNTLPVRPSRTGGEMNERCPHCSATFDDPVALVNHVETKH